MERLRAGVQAVRVRTDLIPRVALALDPELAQLGEAIEDTAAFGAQDLPAVLPPWCDLLLGRLEGAAVAAWTVPASDPGVRARGLPVRLAYLLGADVLFATGTAVALTDLAALPAASPRSASGPGPGPVDLTLVSDHLNLLGDNPLVGPNLEALGPRFPDLSEAYDGPLRTLAHEIAAARGVTLGEGVLAAVPAPNLATAEEYTVLRELGTELAGCAAVPEVIVARHMGMHVLALLVVRGGAHARAHAVGILRDLAARLD